MKYPRTPRCKSICGFIVKIGIAVGLFIWLISQNRLDFSVILSIPLGFKNIALVFFAAVFVFFGLILLALRIWLLLSFKHFQLGFWKALGITSMGSFVGIVLPGLVGGDAAKALYLCSNVAERRMDALTAVFVDRVFGVYSLFLLGSLALGFSWAFGAIPINSRLGLIAPLVVIAIGLCMFLFAWDRVFQSRISKYLISILPKMISSFLVGCRHYLRAPKLFFLIIGLSLLNHCFVIVSFIAAAYILDDNVPTFAHFVIDPLCMALNMIPITPGGIGMAEGAFSLFFQAAGSPNGAIIGLLGRGVQYITFALSGSVAILAGRMKGSIETTDFGASEQAICQERLNLKLRVNDGL